MPTTSTTATRGPSGRRRAPRDDRQPGARRRVRWCGTFRIGVSLIALAAMVAGATAKGGERDRRPPRIASAAMLDLDGDSRADRLRLTYSENVRHGRDGDGQYPLRVAGYRIRSVGAARGRTVMLTLEERRVPDAGARPRVAYRRTGSKPVLDLARNQAVAQTVRAIAFGRPRTGGPGPRGGTAGDPTPGTGTPGGTPGQLTDRDGDGFANAEDCAPDNAQIRPGAPDRPDLGFVDANCDGIDGDLARAVFASPEGSDTNPGTRARPKREIAAAVTTAASQGKYVLAAAGSYDRVALDRPVDIFGGYDPTNWARRSSLVTFIFGSPEGIYVEGATGVVLELLTVRGGTRQVKPPAGATFYGIRAVAGSSLTLRRVSVSGARGLPGAAGANGATGANGEPGAPGGNGECDGSDPGPGGSGGQSPFGRSGGAGGRGGFDTGGAAGTGRPGEPGVFDTPGGRGGPSGNPARAGADGTDGTAGALGTNGAGGLGGAAARFWTGTPGVDGIGGGVGHGGGGGGGGGGQQCIFCDNGAGNGGGGGGAAGAPGGPGTAGGAGGGSFGVFLHDATLTVADASSITASDGGAGGAGGAGAPGGFGGAGGLGSTYCGDEIGEGGNGGFGGAGGHGGGGGGGAGGPSVGIYKAGSSRTTIARDSTVQAGNPGPGGAGGPGGVGSGAAGSAGLGQPVFP